MGSISNVPGSITRYSILGSISDVAGSITNNGGVLILSSGFISRGIVYTQSGNLTYWGSDDAPHIASVDVLPLAYYPITRLVRGYPFWPARTNSLVRYNNYGNASWTKSGSTVSTAALSTIKTISGTMDKIVEDTGNSSHGVYQSVTKAASAITYTHQVKLRSAGRTEARLLMEGSVSGNASVYFNLANGTVLSGPTVSGFTSATATITALGDSVYLCTLTATSNTDTGVFATVYSSSGGNSIYVGNGTDGIYAADSQLETGAYATPVIPTVAAAVTRAAPTCVISGANFSSFYNQTEGTFFMHGEYAAVSTSPNGRVLEVTDGTANNLIQVVSSGATLLRCNGTVATVAQWALSTGNTISDNVRFGFAFHYKANDVLTYLNGANPLTDTSCTLPTVSQMNIGMGVSAGPIGGWVYDLGYYPIAQPAAVLASLST